MDTRALQPNPGRGLQPIIAKGLPPASDLAAACVWGWGRGCGHREVGGLRILRQHYCQDSGYMGFGERKKAGSESSLGCLAS